MTSEANENMVGITTIAEYIAWLDNLSGEDKEENKKFIFRGLVDETWKVEASILRGASGDVSDDYFRRVTQDLLNEARERKVGIIDGKELNDIELLSLLQHNRAATCLIDFTHNALVALWFACDTKISEINGKVIALATADIFRFRIINSNTKAKEIENFIGTGEVWKWSPSADQNNRILSQSSVFILGPKELTSNDFDEVLIAFSAKGDIRKELRSYFGITEAHLFYDLSGFYATKEHDKESLDNEENKKHKADEYFDRAVDCSQSHDWPNALELYNLAIELNSKHAKAYNHRGILNADMGNTDDAMKDYKEALSIDDQYIDAYNNRGLLQAALGNTDEAMGDYNEAVRLKPRYAEAYKRRGNLKSDINDTDGAMKDFDMAISIDPQDAELYYDRGRLNVGIKSSDGAMKDFDMAINIDPQNVAVFTNRAVLKWLLADLEGAVRDCSMAISINPHYAKAYYNRGRLKASMDNSDGAMEDYDKAILFDDEYADAYYHRSVLKSDLGDDAGAEADYEMAHKLDPESYPKKS